MLDLEKSGSAISALIRNEIDTNNIEARNVFLAGLGQGGRMVYNVAFAHLEENIGGYFPMASCPLWPAMMETTWFLDEENFLFYDEEMNWFMFMGEDDAVYNSTICQDEYQKVFEILDIEDAIAYEVIAEEVKHEADQRFFDVMM